MSEPLPHDHPSRRERARLYVALTNACNRACPWCSTYSGPRGRTHLSPEALLAHLPPPGATPIDVQLEGGEPLVHPDFWVIIGMLRANLEVATLILCTNGFLVPRSAAALDAWLARLGAPLLVKLSINHHLLARDRRLLDVARLLDERLGDALVLNVRRRRGGDDDAWVMERVRDAGLAHRANDFFLQRYGRAADETTWDEPFVVRGDFTLVNPDGAPFVGDLVARSEAMGRLP